MGPCRLLKTIFAQFLGKYRVVSALFGKIERLTFTGTFDAFQHLVKSHSFKQICFPHCSEMGVLKSFLSFGCNLQNAVMGGGWDRVLQMRATPEWQATRAMPKGRERTKLSAIFACGSA